MIRCFQSFAILLYGMVVLLPGQGASGENIRRRDVEDTYYNTTIVIKSDGVLDLTISEYLKDQDFMRLCIRMNDKKTARIAFSGYDKERRIDKYKEIVSAAERAISDDVSKFSKIQCLNSTGKEIRRDDVSEPTDNIKSLRENIEWQRIQLLTRNYTTPWTESFHVTIDVQIHGQSAINSFFENPCFKFYWVTGFCDIVGSLYNFTGTAFSTADYVPNYKDPHINPKLLEGKAVALVYAEGIISDVESYFTDYKFCKELDTLEETKKYQKPKQLVKKSDPANNTKFLEEVNGILENGHETPEKTLHELDRLSLAWAAEDRPVTVVKDGVAVFVPDKLVRGFWVSSTAGQSEFEKYSYDFFHEEPSSRILRSQESDVVVTLPPSAQTRQVSFIIFRNESLFPSQKNGFIINSLVISINIENVTHFHGGEVIDIHFRPIAMPRRNESLSCAYWHFLENSTGYWSQEGCDLIRANKDGMLDTCRCNHLTHFAEILVAKTGFSEANERALEILTIAGCSLSIMGLIVVGATALLFRSWRQDFRNKIWLQMCMAILILVVNFLMVIFVQHDRYHVKCLLLGVTLHYAVLASFCWMLVAAVLAYRQLTLVYTRDVPHKLLRVAVFAWGTPGVVCSLLLSVSPESYAGRFQEMTPGGNFCYPTGLSLWLTVYAPISIILVTNWTLLALILRSVFCSKKIRRYGGGDEPLRIVSVNFTLGFLFGLPWVFGLFASNVVAAYLFTLTATFQGFVLFALLVIGNKKTQELWVNKMFKKRNHMPMRLVSDNESRADLTDKNYWITNK